MATNTANANTNTNTHSNQIRAAVLLKDATSNLNEAITNCRILIHSIIRLPRGSNTTKELNRLSLQLNYMHTVGILSLIELPHSFKSPIPIQHIYTNASRRQSGLLIDASQPV